MSALLAHAKAYRALALSCAREADRNAERARKGSAVAAYIVAVLGAQAAAYTDAAARLERMARAEASGT